MMHNTFVCFSTLHYQSPRRMPMKSVFVVSASLTFLLASSASATSITLNTTAPATDVYSTFSGVAMDNTSISNVWRNWKSKASNDYDQTVGTTFQVGAADVLADKATILVARTTAVNNVPMKFILYHASQRDDAGGDLAGTFGAPTADTIVSQF